jgi:hypothetical protein
MDPLLAQRKAEEERKHALTAELTSLADVARVVSLDVKRVQAGLRARVADVRGLLGRRIPQTRQLVRKILTGRLACEAFAEPDGSKGYRFSGEATYGRLLAGEARRDGSATSVGVPDGIRTRVSVLTSVVGPLR